MEQDFFNFAVETLKLYQDPNIENQVKEKAIKTLLKRSVDIQPNYGYQTKQELKCMIEYSSNAKDLFDAINAYFLTHDIRL